MWHSGGMARRYYSTQPFLAWCLSHFFYDERHFAYVGAPFHPYKRSNPGSSNPWKIYGAQYEPWYDRDPYDAQVEQKRRNLRKGVAFQAHALGPALEYTLAWICENVDQAFFMPIVYVVDIDSIDPVRLHKSGSALLVPSDEYTVGDLSEDEFEVLFFDSETDVAANDTDLRALGAAIDGVDVVAPADALDRLLRRCT